MIRQAKIDDAKQIINIKINSWNDTYKGLISDDILNKIDYKTEYEKFIKNFNKRKIVVYEEQDEILGYAYYLEENNSKEHESEIQALYVKKDCRKKGIGTELIKYIFKELKENKNNRVILKCAKGNKNAIKFYEKIGFKYVKENTEMCNDGEIEEIVFIKEID